jgi:TonB-dependent receptor
MSRHTNTITMRFRIAICLITLLSSAILTGKASADDWIGKISGIVVDAVTGEALPGVSIQIEGTSLGAATDIEGKYTIRLVPTGMHTLIVSMVGYTRTTVTGVLVATDSTTAINVSLTETALNIEGIKVEAKSLDNSEAAMLNVRQKAAAVSDAISFEGMQKSGAGNAADALARTPGATVMGGYAFIRGLGDRYSNTTLNGSVMPSPDPDKQAVPVDLVPSGLLDNIVVQKTFTADKPGNFSGGSVNLQTRSFPEGRSFSISSSRTNNSLMSDNALGALAGSGDKWGYDNGLRAIPDYVTENLSSMPSGAISTKNRDQAFAVDRLTKAFSSEGEPQRRKYPVSPNYSIMYGNTKSLFGHPLGLVGTLSYNRTYSTVTDGIYERYDGISTNPSSDLGTRIIHHSFASGKDEVLLGGMASIAYELSKNDQIHLTSVYNRNGESEVRLYENGIDYYNLSDDPNVQFRRRVFHYTERTLKSLQLRGAHHGAALFGTEARVDWQGNLSSSSQEEPDYRFYTDIVDYSSGTPTYQINLSSYNIFPTRLWRDLSEKNKEGRIDFTFPLSKSVSLKTGLFSLSKTREASQDGYQLVINTPGQIGYDGNFDHLLDNAGLKDTLPDQYGYYVFNSNYRRFVRSENNYTGSQTISAWYGQMDIHPTSRLNAIVGLRHESTDMETRSENSSFGVGSIEGGDYLPTVNLVYSLAKTINLRAAYGYTLARPTLREMSSSIDEVFQGGAYFVGNPNIERTRIRNYDLRLEWFERPGEIWAVSGFYKGFRDPIELQFIDNNYDVSPVNVDKATVYGIELEVRKRLDQTFSFLRNFSAGANLTFVHSEVEIPETEFFILKYYDANVKNSRPMYGQSPFVVNFDLGYSSERLGTDINVVYNRVGDRLAINSTGATPDVYEKSREMLDVIAAQKLWRGVSVKMSAKNIMDAKKSLRYKYKTEEPVYEEYSMGRTISLGVSVQPW